MMAMFLAALSQTAIASEDNVCQTTALRLYRFDVDEGQFLKHPLKLGVFSESHRIHSLQSELSCSARWGDADHFRVQRLWIQKDDTVFQHNSTKFIETEALNAEYANGLWFISVEAMGRGKCDWYVTITACAPKHTQEVMRYKTKASLKTEDLFAKRSVEPGGLDFDEPPTVATSAFLSPTSCGSSCTQRSEKPSGKSSESIEPQQTVPPVHVLWSIENEDDTPLGHRTC